MALGKFHPLHEVGLRETAAAPAPKGDPVVKQLESDEARMRTAYLAAMDELGIDVLAFPRATYPPKLNGDRNTTPPAPYRALRPRCIGLLPWCRWVTAMRTSPAACSCLGGHGLNRF